MNPVDYILIGIIALILAAAGWFLYKSKKSGKKCIGCPDSGACSNVACNGGCGCGCSHAGTKND